MTAPDGFVQAALLADLTDDTPVRVVVGTTPVCLVRSGDAVHAISDVCSHADVSLSEGDVEGGQIECWLHGSRFDLVTGAPSGLPAITPVPVYRTTVSDDAVFVSLEKES